MHGQIRNSAHFWSSVAIFWELYRKTSALSQMMCDWFDNTTVLCTLRNTVVDRLQLSRTQSVVLLHLKALVFLYAFEESVDYHLLSSFCDDSNLHISVFKYVLSTIGVSKESISKFLIGNRFHVKLRIKFCLNKDWGCVILCEIDFLLKICWSIPCLHPSWKVHTWIVLLHSASGKLCIYALCRDWI